MQLELDPDRWRDQSIRREKFISSSIATDDLENLRGEFDRQRKFDNWKINTFLN